MPRLHPAILIFTLLITSAPYTAHAQSVAATPVAGEQAAQQPTLQTDSLVSDTGRIMQAWRALEDDPVVGGPVPDFSLQLYDHPSRTLTTRSMRGRKYLLVLWSPRDRASTSFMISLAESLEPWAASGVRVLTAAFHSSSADVAEHRSALPAWWSFSVLSRNHGKRMLEDFSVWRLPVAYLVDKEGTIVASGLKLQPPWLDVTLEQLLK